MNPLDYLAVALDTRPVRSMRRLREQLHDKFGPMTFKVGHEMEAHKEVFDLYKDITESGDQLFLDKKLTGTYDTIYNSVTEFCFELKPTYMTISHHMDILQATAKAKMDFNLKTKFLSVATLTSMPLNDRTKAATRLAAEEVRNLQGYIDGMACGIGLLRTVRLVLPGHFVAVPGIRLISGTHQMDNHKIVAAPGRAIVDGAGLAIVGRPICNADNPIVVLQEYLDNIAMWIGRKQQQQAIAS